MHTLISKSRGIADRETQIGMVTCEAILNLNEMNFADLWGKTTAEQNVTHYEYVKQKD